MSSGITKSSMRPSCMIYLYKGPFGTCHLVIQILLDGFAPGLLFHWDIKASSSINLKSDLVKRHIRISSNLDPLHSLDWLVRGDLQPNQLIAVGSIAWNRPGGMGTVVVAVGQPNLWLNKLECLFILNKLRSYSINKPAVCCSVCVIEHRPAPLQRKTLIIKILRLQLFLNISCKGLFHFPSFPPCFLCPPFDWDDQ